MSQGQSLSQSMEWAGKGKSWVLSCLSLPQTPSETDRAVETCPGYDLHISRAGQPRAQGDQAFFEAVGLERESDQSEFRMLLYKSTRVKLGKQEGWLLTREVNMGPAIAGSQGDLRPNTEGS